MPEKKSNPYAEISEMLSQVGSTPAAPSTLPGFAKSHNYRITSGFSRGGHNSGSMHYQGSPEDPGAIDIDHRNVDYNRLLADARAAGFEVHDERQRPKGQAVWSGPHYHVSKKRTGGGKVSTAPKASAPTSSMQPRTATPDLTLPVSSDAQGNIVFNNMPVGSGVHPQKLKTLPKAKLSVKAPGDFSEDYAGIQALLDEVGKPAPQAPAAAPVQPQTNFFGDAANRFMNAAAGYSQDDLVRQSGQGVGAFIGDLAGSLVPVGAGALLGSPLGPVGAIAGGVVGAGGAGTAQDLQAQRLEGKTNPDLARALGAGAIQGGLQAIPVLKGGSLLARAAKNAAVQGVGAGVGSGIQQGIEQHTFTPNLDFNRVRDMAALGAAGGVVGGAIEGKPKPNADLGQVPPKAPAPEFKTEGDLIRNIAEIERKQQADDILNILKQPDSIDPNATGIPKNGFVGRNGEVISKSRYEAPAVDVTPKAESLNTPEQTRDLGDAFSKRQAGEAQPIIDPRTGKPYDPAALERQAVQDIGIKDPVQEPVSDSGLTVAREGAVKEDVPIPVERGLPEGERVYSKPEAPRSESILDPATGQPFKPTERPLRSSVDIGLDRAQRMLDDADAPKALDASPPPVRDLGTAKPPELGTPKPQGLLDAQGRVLGEKAPTPDLAPTAPRPGELLDGQGRPLDLATRPTRDIQDLSAPKQPQVDPSNPKSLDKPGNVYRTPQGGEVFTHGRDAAMVEADIASVKDQLTNIADIERHLQTRNPEALPAIRNVLDAGKNSEAVQFSYVAREAPGEPARARANFVPTHFTFETIKPGTQRAYLRRKFGDDEAVISHLKQEIVNAGGSVDAAGLQTKGGAAVKPATQISKLIAALDSQTGGAYLKSPRVHGLNLGESTRTGAVDRGIRLDTITESSLTGRKVTPEDLQAKGASYNNQIAPAISALEELAKQADAPKGMDRIIKQINSGKISKKTANDLRSMLKSSPEKLGQVCKMMGL